MSKMTRKQVDAYFDNPDSWEVIPCSDLVQTAFLDYKDLHICCILYSTDANRKRWISKDECPEVDREFVRLSYMLYDPDLMVMEYAVSATWIKEQIYRRQ